MQAKVEDCSRTVAKYRIVHLSTPVQSHSLLLCVFSGHIDILRLRRERGLRFHLDVATRSRPYCAHSRAEAELLRNHVYRL